MEEVKNPKVFIEDGMEYNTNRRDIKLTQYGRNIQKLVDYALTLTDREKRNNASNQIVQAMEILNPRVKQIDDYKRVLWNHLAIMSNFQLDVDYPYEIVPEDVIKSKPELVPLIKTRLNKKQYGRIIADLIKKAVEIEDKELQQEFVLMILVQMKRIYINWTKDVVSDDVIFEDFKAISNYQLSIPTDFKLPQSYEIKNRIKTHQPTQQPSKKFRKR